MRGWEHTQCCKSVSEEPGAGNPHARFCGGLGCELRNPSTRRFFCRGRIAAQLAEPVGQAPGGARMAERHSARSDAVIASAIYGIGYPSRVMARLAV